jgi:Host cell surface-exposed lipoprotein
VVVVTEPAPVETQPAETPTVEDSDETSEQQNARETAESYLETGGFSRSGLIEQLVFEGFTRAQAEYGVQQAY